MPVRAHLLIPAATLFRLASQQFCLWQTFGREFNRDITCNLFLNVPVSSVPSRLMRAIHRCFRPLRFRIRRRDSKCAQYCSQYFLLCRLVISNGIRQSRRAQNRNLKPLRWSISIVVRIAETASVTHMTAERRCHESRMRKRDFIDTSTSISMRRLLNSGAAAASLTE